MVELIALALRAGYLIFIAICTILGLVGLAWVAMALVEKTCWRLLNVALLVNAMIEARRQGRAPVLRFMAWWRRRHGQDQ